MKKSQTFLKIVGDCHGMDKEFIKLTKDCQNIIQLGDFSFDYSCLPTITKECNVKILAGNHDNYDLINDYKEYFLGDFGIHNIGNIEFFFVRGGFSVDWQQRADYNWRTGKTVWWEQEQLSYSRMLECLQYYKQIKPSIIFTHEAPRQIANLIGNPNVLRNYGYDPDIFTTNTGELLQSMFEFHQPKLWCFAHYHKYRNINVDGTNFICLPELGQITLNKEGHICV